MKSGNWEGGRRSFRALGHYSLIMAAAFTLQVPQANADGLAEALKNAEANPVVVADRGSLQSAIARYREILSKYAGDSETWVVELRIIGCLAPMSSFGDEQDLLQARSLLREAVRIRAFSKIGEQEIALRYVEFELRDGRNLTGRDLESAGRIAAQLCEDCKPGSLLAVKSWRYRGEVAEASGLPTDAIDYYFTAMDQAILAIGKLPRVPNAEFDDLRMETLSTVADIGQLVEEHDDAAVKRAVEAHLARRPAFPVTYRSSLVESFAERDARSK